MPLTKEALEVAFARLRDVALGIPAVAAEARASAGAFFGGGSAAAYGPGAGAGLAERRHLEWFLLERPSEALGGVPAEALMERWLGEVGPELEEHPETLLASLAGVFEVTSVEPGRGVWLRDLLGLGEYPVDEPEAAAAVAVGDVTVGRIFPVGESLFRLSPAAALFRSEGLGDALRSDLELARGGRRGTLRISQAEIERMFHAPAAAAEAEDEPRDAVRAEAEARARLAEAGVPEALADEVLGALAEAVESPAGAGGGVVTEALNEVAFETDADLEVARRALAELWSTLVARAPGAPGAPAPRAPRAPGRAGAPGATSTNEAGASDRGASREEVRAALARFDAARAQGRDLESVFTALEADLGIEPAGAGEDPGAAPDFPGAVAAMVEEFLWESAREDGEETARRRGVLRALGRYGSRVGVFENLGRRELLDFAGRWVLDERELASAADAERLLEALAAFCRWSEATQEVALWTLFGETLERLATSLPRLAALRARWVDGPQAGGRVFRFARDAEGGSVLVDADEERRSVALDRELAAGLAPRDLVRARLRPGGRADVLGCYPPEVEDLVPVEPDAEPGSPL